ncbi:MAG TPA: penicillin-binding transpeptidase domain-containing protein, partial [Lysobacter sp.]|nr:penicillin-binding transpeptidase domain-containing protein [Lysobacter sp.]
MSARNDRNRKHLVGRVADALRARIDAKPAAGSARARHQRGGLDLRKRLLIVAGALGLGSLALVVRAFDVQVVNSEFYLQQGQARSLREIPIPTSRGMITDRNGEPLAVSTPVESVWGNPKELLENPARIPELAKALDVPVDVLTRKLTQRANKEFLYLKRRISPEQSRRILAHNIPGVFSQREFRRFYPQGEAMAHVLGFTNIDDRGQEGLELSFDHILSGKPGSKRVIRDGQGRIVESVDLIRPAEPGHDLTLTIDRRIQFLAYRELRNQLTKTGASSGSAVVLDIATGEVLAMVNLPSYNPNAVAMGNVDTHRNRAVTDVFEPGSTMKPITVAAALNARIVTPDTRIDLNPGYMALDRRYTVSDHNNYGVQTITGIITKSSNIGAAKLAARMDDKYFYEFIRQFGYGQKPDSGFPGESAGVLAPPSRW